MSIFSDLLPLTNPDALREAATAALPDYLYGPRLPLTVTAGPWNVSYSRETIGPAPGSNGRVRGGIVADNLGAVRLSLFNPAKDYGSAGYYAAEHGRVFPSSDSAQAFALARGYLKPYVPAAERVRWGLSPVPKPYVTRGRARPLGS